MKRKIISVIVILLLLAILFLPIPNDTYKDGGTKFYTALTYRVVKWNVMIDADDIYTKTRVYWFPDNLKSYDELWKLETQ